MKNKFSFNMSIGWILVLFVIGIAILLFAPKGELISNDENRMLQAMPDIDAETILSGDFSREFELFMSDKFFGRSSIVELASEIRAKFSILSFDDILEFGDGVEDNFQNDIPQEDGGGAAVSGGDAADTEVSDSDAQVGHFTENGATDTESNLLGRSYLGYWLNGTDGKSSDLMRVEKSDVLTTVNIVNRFARLLPEGGNVFYINVPQAWKVNKYVQNLNRYIGWENNVDLFMQNYVHDNVTVFSSTEIFNEPIRNGEYVFFRTDTHWTPLGAHYAYSAIMKHQGIEPIPYEVYPKKSLHNFLGAYYDMYQTAALKNQADRLDVLTPVIPTKYYRFVSKNNYQELPIIDYDKGVEHAIYLGGNLGPLTVLRSEAGTGRKAVMIKDSFGLIPAIYFSAHYDELYLIDPRFYDAGKVGCSVSQFIEDYEIDDIYFVVCDINSHGKEFTTFNTYELL